MKKIFILILSTITLVACRKDNSTFLNVVPKTGNNGDKCLVTGSDIDGLKNVATYQSDSVIKSVTYAETPEYNDYLIKETETTYLHSDVSANLEDANYRVYLNSFGAVAKEVQVVLNADKKTFTEVTENANIYTYNAQKQVINVNGKLDPDDSSYFEMFYDEQNRIKQILVYDEKGGEVYYIYDNFKFSTQPKTDNFSQIGILNTVGHYFMPSFRNFYITHYETNYIGFGLPPDTYDFDFKFNNGKVSQIDFTYVIFGIKSEFTSKLTLSCN